MSSSMKPLTDSRPFGEIVECNDEDDERDAPIIKGRRHNLIGLYEEKKNRSKNVSLMDLQLKDELDDFKKLELMSSHNSSRGRNNKVMDVDRDISIKNSRKSSDKMSLNSPQNYVNKNANKFKKIKGSYHNLFR
jgi:hypothetical protein